VRGPVETRSTDDTLEQVGTPALQQLDAERYELGEEIGRGGWGRLIRARDRKLGRDVALKLLRRVSAAQEIRFQREAEITARLQHPGIVPIHEVGRFTNGEPFYVMKLVSGRSLKEVLSERGTLDQRLPLIANVLAVCEAIGFAHSQGFIHRDLKPANVMLGDFGETLVIDWGLAKHVGSTDDPSEPASPSPDASATASGDVVGTPAYMPPEQARADAVDRRADVYALGSILYHLLAGHAPFRGESQTEVTGAVILGPPPSLALMAKGAPPELVAITEKAMARDAAARYGDAGDLAADLRRFLDGRLVTAHRYTLWRRARRFVRRHRGAVAAVTLSLTALATLGSYSIWRVVGERRRAESALERVEEERSSLLLAQASRWLDHDPTVAVAWLKEYARSAQPKPDEIGALAVEARSLGAARQLFEGRAYAVLAPDGHTLAAIEDGQLVVWDTAGGAARRLGPIDDQQFVYLSFAPDMQRVFAAAGGVVQTWHLASGGARELYRGDEPALMARPAGNLIAAGGERGTIWIFDPVSGERRIFSGHKSAIRWLESSSDGRVILSHSKDREVRLWQVATGTSEVLPLVHCQRPMLAPDGTQVAWISDDDNDVHLYNLGDRKSRVFPGHPGGLHVLAFSADSKRLASGGGDNTARVWDLASGKSQALAGAADWIMRLAFSSDGMMLGATCLDRSVWLWDLEAGVGQHLLGHKSSLIGPQFSPDGRDLVTADYSGQVRVWPVTRTLERVVRLHAHDEIHLGFLPDGRLLSIDFHGTLTLTDPRSGPSRSFTQPGVGGIIDISPDGRLVADGGGGGDLWIRDLASGALTTLRGHSGAIQDVAFASDGKSVATAGADHTIRIWNLEKGQSRVLGRHGDPVWHVVFSPDRKLLVSAGDDLALKLWDLSTGQSRDLVGHHDIVYAVRFSPDGRFVASAGLDPIIRIWDVRDGSSRAFKGHIGLVQDLAFSPDGRLLASASDDGTVRLWDLASGESRSLAHGTKVLRVLFTPDGSQLVTGARGTVRVWDVARSSERAVGRSPSMWITSVAISPDRHRIAAGNEDGETFVWAGLLDAPPPPASAADLLSLGAVVLAGDRAASPR
jgi:WD40 repeat protein